MTIQDPFSIAWTLFWWRGRTPEIQLMSTCNLITFTGLWSHKTLHRNILYSPFISINSPMESK